jgi:hypothetical protein
MKKQRFTDKWRNQKARGKMGESRFSTGEPPEESTKKYRLSAWGLFQTAIAEEAFT